jgi:hypothetical protein
VDEYPTLSFADYARKTNKIPIAHQITARREPEIFSNKFIKHATEGK